MPKYWGKQIFSHGSFSEVGEKQKAKGKKVGENNGQLRFVRHHGWRMQAAWTKKWPACFRPPPRVAHASRLDQLKLFVPGTTSLPGGLWLCHMFSGVVSIISLHLQLRLNTSEYRWIWEEGSEIVL